MSWWAAVGLFNTCRQQTKSGIGVFCPLSVIFELLNFLRTFVLYCVSKMKHCNRQINLILYNLIIIVLSYQYQYIVCKCEIDMYNLVSPIDLCHIFPIYLLLYYAGDVERNPGPTINNKHCLSIFHQKIRGIPNKLEYNIRDSILI